MNENLNLSKILKDCPKGMLLWSPFLGEIEFIRVKNDVIYVDRVGIEFAFFSDGKYDREGECMLFPSKDQRDWSKFKTPIKKFDPKEFKPFDKVLIRDDNGFKWIPSILEKISQKTYGGYLAVELISRCKWKMCIPYNDETKHLVGTTDDCPEFYKWWEE